MDVILSLDQGTSRSRAILFNHAGKIVGMDQKELSQLYPQAGWVEHRPMEILRSLLDVMETQLQRGHSIKAIGISNQRETAVVWDKNTGEPVYNAIVWQCRRTAPFCEELKEEGWGEKIRKKTGLPIDAYFSASKVKWILDNVRGARERAKKGELLFGTVDTWMIWNLTGRKVHATDYSNASRTLLYNIHTLQWDREILERFDIPPSMLPQVKNCSDNFGKSEQGIPICGIAGDQQAALFGQACFDKGDVKNTYGTGCFTLMQTGDKPVSSSHGLLTTIAMGLDGKVDYALEGAVFVAGAAIQWLRDELGIITEAAESEELASEVPDSNGVYFVPAFVGLGSPYWDMYARGSILGLSRGAHKKHLVRAALESIAFQSLDLVKAMEKDSGIPMREMKVDGAASQNNLLMQMQANFNQASVLRPDCVETTALGVAFLAGLKVGFWEDKDELKSIWSLNQKFNPQMEENVLKVHYAGWKKAVECAKAWIEK